MSKLLFESKKLIAPFVKIVEVSLRVFTFFRSLGVVDTDASLAATALLFLFLSEKVSVHFFLNDYLELDLEHSLRHPFLQFLLFHRTRTMTTRMNDFCALFYVRLNTACAFYCCEFCPSDSRNSGVSVQYKRIFHEYTRPTAVNEIVPHYFSLTISSSS